MSSNIEHECLKLIIWNFTRVQCTFKRHVISVTHGRLSAFQSQIHKHANVYYERHFLIHTNLNAGKSHEKYTKTELYAESISIIFLVKSTVIP